MPPGQFQLAAVLGHDEAGPHFREQVQGSTVLALGGVGRAEEVDVRLDAAEHPVNPRQPDLRLPEDA